jgi:hypothetical protein
LGAGRAWADTFFKPPSRGAASADQGETSTENPA